jgi:hypothetical protein
VQLSASAGIKPGVRIHLWGWWERPVGDGELKAIFEQIRAAGVAKHKLNDNWLDLSVCGAVQPHYAADPVFEGGMADPFPSGRLFLIEGSSDTVAVPKISGRDLYGDAIVDKCEKKLRSACNAIEKAAHGKRNIVLNTQSFSVGTISNVLGAERCLRELKHAAATHIIGPDAMSAEDIESTIKRALTQGAAKPLYNVDAAECSDKIAAAYAGRRNTPFSRNQLEGLAAMMGLESADDLPSRLVVRLGGGKVAFLRPEVDDEGDIIRADYVVQDASDFELDARQWLAVFVNVPNVWLQELTDKGVKWVPAKILADRHGTKPSAVVRDLVGEASTHNPITGVFTHAVYRYRTDLEAEYSHEIAEWLSAFAGAKLDEMLDWLARFRSNLPTPGLFLYGPPGHGKSLIADLLARFYEGQATPADAAKVLQKHNGELLTTSPVVLADEKTPEDFRGKPFTEELRKLITAVKHSVEPKGSETYTVRGAVRVVVAKNHQVLVKSSQIDLTQDDADALAERFIELKVGGKKLPPETAKRWLENDTFLKHVLWLEQNRQIAPSARLAVQASGGDMADRMLVHTGVRAGVLAHVVSAVMDPRRQEVSRFTGPPSIPGVRVANGQVWVNAARIYEQHEVYHRFTSRVTPELVRDAVVALAPVPEGEKPRKLPKYNDHDKRAYYRKLPMNLLNKCLSDQDIPLEDFQAALAAYREPSDDKSSNCS